MALPQTALSRCLGVILQPDGQHEQHLLLMAELLQNISNWQEEGSYVLLITFFVSLSITLLVSHCYIDKKQSTPKHTHSTWTNTVTSERWYGWARGSETLFGWQVEVASVQSLLKVERRRVLLDRFLHAAREQEAPWTLSDCMWLSVRITVPIVLFASYGCEQKCVLRILQGSRRLTWRPAQDDDGSTLISYLSRAIYFRHEPTLPAVISTVLLGIVDNPVKMPDSQGLKKAIAIVVSFLMLSPLHLSTSTRNEEPFVPWSHDSGESPRKEAVICGGPDYSPNPSQRASASLQIHTSCTNH